MTDQGLHQSLVAGVKDGHGLVLGVLISILLVLNLPVRQDGWCAGSRVWKMGYKPRLFFLFCFTVCYTTWECGICFNNVLCYIAKWTNFLFLVSRVCHV